ncbi:hypothetical protein JCM17845_00870 [Iodidimonas gelatinilytica]|uniref:Squalene synthase HpnD n=1 Tax=Iodidimonas gelatinilytica TaxID=1236966 RepID=A0A5A7MVR1_9PROT|nr:presqualene diphosphate synthase HpnD [Iodidimonas gelatinilytica]GEQ99463.1 hypothetical protein JCM17845_00870 [Iodidimonas gelatinilytica]
MNAPLVQISAPDDKADRIAIARQVRSAGSSFYWAMRLMSPERRAALFAIYAFCREVDDIADGPLKNAEKKAQLARWHDRIDALYESTTDPSGNALDRVLKRSIMDYGLDKADFIAVIRGMEMDADGPIRAPSFEELMDYCDCVASAVGRLCVRVFGAPELAGRTVSDHLGKALQLTNIIRDVSEDAEMGRLYLPRDLLAKAGIKSTDPMTVAHAPHIGKVKQALAKQAAEEFSKAETALRACDCGDMRPAVIMMVVYRRIFERMKKDGYQTRRQSKIKRALDKAEKLWIAAKIALGGRSWRASI